MLERKQEHAVLRIRNQVIHSEQIDIEHVFDRFYKADVARSKTSTGLGLSIAKELVKRMNGEISAKTEKNEFIIEKIYAILVQFNHVKTSFNLIYSFEITATILTYFSVSVNLNFRNSAL